MVKRFLAYLLIGLGLAQVLFYRSYSGVLIQYPLVVWLLGIAMCYTGWILLKSSQSLKTHLDQLRVKKAIEAIKTSGEKIKVEFSDCEIKENNYIEEPENPEKLIDFSTEDLEREIEDLDALYGKQNQETLEVNQTVLIYKTNWKGKPVKFISRVLPYERASLLFKLDAQKATTLYVDGTDAKNYYFDLDFLAN